MIAVENLIFEYPGVRALDGVSFAIETSSITALVGPNGAGKTTLIRCMAALDTPFAGRVLLEGQDVHEHPRESHREIGYLSDFFGLYDDLTVAQCLDYRARTQKIPAEGRPTASKLAAARVRLSDRMTKKAGELSRGLRQRLAIAQAIVHQPRFLFLDEPASGLDPEARLELSVLLRALREDGMTILVSSHILAELEDYSTHMLILNEGKVVEHCPVDAALTGMRRRFTLRLARPDNRLAPALAKTQGVVDIQADENGAEFALEGGAEAAGDLLRGLVEAGLPVCEFSSGQPNLQDAYLARVKAGGAS